MAVDLRIKNNAMCCSILKTISKLRDQTSLSWKLTSVHSKDGHSTEITRQSKIKEPLLINGKLKSLVQSLKNFWFLQKLESRQKFPTVCLFVCLFCFNRRLPEGRKWVSQLGIISHCVEASYYWWSEQKEALFMMQIMQNLWTASMQTKGWSIAQFTVQDIRVETNSF